MENFPIYRKNFLYCKYSNSSKFGRKYADFSKLENFPPYPFGLKLCIKVASLARSVPKPLKVPSLARSVLKPLKVPKSDLDLDDDHKI